MPRLDRVLRTRRTRLFARYIARGSLLTRRVAPGPTLAAVLLGNAPRRSQHLNRRRFVPARHLPRTYAPSISDAPATLPLEATPAPPFTHEIAVELPAGDDIQVVEPDSAMRTETTVNAEPAVPPAIADSMPQPVADAPARSAPSASGPAGTSAPPVAPAVTHAVPIEHPLSTQVDGVLAPDASLLSATDTPGDDMLSAPHASIESVPQPLMSTPISLPTEPAPSVMGASSTSPSLVADLEHEPAAPDGAPRSESAQAAPIQSHPMSAPTDVVAGVVPPTAAATQAPTLSESAAASSEIVATPPPIVAGNVEQTDPTLPPIENVRPRRPRPERTAAADSGDGAGNLFSPRTDVDLSPQAWAARLFTSTDTPAPPPAAPSAYPPTMTAQEFLAQLGEVVEGERDAAVGAPEAATAPHDAAEDAVVAGAPPARTVPPMVLQETPLADTTRRFVAPLVGIDPGSVRVRRGPAAEAAVAAQAADAATAGDVIALGAGHPESEPETTALLAHELVHVARRRSPRHIPPVLHPPGPDATAPNFPAASPSADDEEAVALAVERAVLPLARARRVGLPVPEISPNIAAGQSDPEEEPLDRRRWSGLPAPWEPLPSWLSPTAPTFAPPAGNSGGGSGNGAPPGDGATPMRAEQGRPISATEAEQQPPAPTPAQAAQQPPPDLDALAIQVYALLKQRLATERQRIGLG